MATFSGENIAGLDHKSGLAAGVFMAWQPDELLSLETGASWIRKPWHWPSAAVRPEISSPTTRSEARPSPSGSFRAGASRFFKSSA